MGDHDAERRHEGPARSKRGVTTRILIALGATYFRRAIEDRLGAEPGLEVVATANDGPSTLDALARPVVAAARVGRRSPGKAVATAVGARDDNRPPTELVEPVRAVRSGMARRAAMAAVGNGPPGRSRRMAASVGEAGSSGSCGSYRSRLGGQEPGEGGRPDPEPASRLTAGELARGKVGRDPWPAGDKARPGRDRRPADPRALAGSMAHPFPYPLGDELALHLCHRGQDREHEPPSRRRRVELGLGERREPDPRMLEVASGGEGIEGRAR